MLFPGRLVYLLFCMYISVHVCMQALKKIWYKMRRWSSWMTMFKANRSKGPNERRERAFQHKKIVLVAVHLWVCQEFINIVCIVCISSSYRDSRMIAQDERSWMRCTSMHKNCFYTFWYLYASTKTIAYCVQWNWKIEEKNEMNVPCDS